MNPRVCTVCGSVFSSEAGLRRHETNVAKVEYEKEGLGPCASNQKEWNARLMNQLMAY
jgi:hypothetical protein